MRASAFMRPCPRTRVAVGVLLLGLIVLPGCGPTRVRRPVPENLIEQAQIPGMPGVRAFGGRYSPVFQERMVESVRQEIESGLFDPDAANPGTVDILALSGGGADGAFGAGLLAGWSEHGDRPSFKLVTGISTGALIAPFAFLGPERDEELRSAYTGITDQDIYERKPLLAALGSDSLVDTSPMMELLRKLVDDELIAEIAAEHRKGRRLFIATTNLDAQQPVIWDMGAIADGGHRASTELFRNIMRASAAVPVAFPPVYFQVEACGECYDEMHVDGGVTTQVFMYGSVLKPMAMAKQLKLDRPRRRARAFIIRNTHVNALWKPIDPGLLPIAGRSVSTLLKFHGVGDLYRMYTLTRRDGIEYNLAFIPGDFRDEAETAFDPSVMKKLYQLGYDMARSGYPWASYPPGFEPSADSAATKPAVYR